MCKACKSPVDKSYGFCLGCWKSLRDGEEKALLHFYAALQEGPHDATEESMLLDNLTTDLWEVFKGEKSC